MLQSISEGTLAILTTVAAQTDYKDFLERQRLPTKRGFKDWLQRLAIFNINFALNKKYPQRLATNIG